MEGKTTSIDLYCFILGLPASDKWKDVADMANEVSLICLAIAGGEPALLTNAIPEAGLLRNSTASDEDACDDFLGRHPCDIFTFELDAIDSSTIDVPLIKLSLW